MAERRYFYFALGPVQEFVGKARRLRDYWTGSYLLSYLTKQAMDEVCKQGGRIVFPPYGEKNNADTDKGEIGSYPNKFQAKVPVSFNPSCCEERIKTTWEKIANNVWEKYIAKVSPLGKNTREIWERQVEGYWSMQWLIADVEDDTLLDQRKKWRNHIPTVEPGDSPLGMRAKAKDDFGKRCKHNWRC